MYQQLIEHVGEQLYSSLSSYTCLDQRIIGFLVQKERKSTALDLEVSPKGDPIQRWGHWRQILKTVLLASFEGKLEAASQHLREKWYALIEQKSFDGFQAELLYAKITAHYLNISEELILEVPQNESGFYPLCSQNHWRLLKTPLIDQHAELGTLLILLGKLTNDPQLINQGCKAALWHTKNIDDAFIPYRGFLSNHSSCSYSNIVLKQATLFHCASLALGDNEMAYLAKKHFSHLLSTKAHQLKDISLESLLMWPLIDKLFQNQLTPIVPELPSEIYEENHSIAGLRNDNLSILCSLMGSNSSMGTLKFGSLQVAAFGPQLGDLGEGKHFGFIDLSKKGKSSEIIKSDNSFVLKGLVGLPKMDEKSSLLQSWQHATCWLDTKLTCKNEAVTIQVKPLRLSQEAYFVFYIIADQCLIKGRKKILYQSLDQFQGKACSVSFLNRNQLMTLDLSRSEGSMKIIPLEGGQSFWGANYLIGYHLNNKYSTFEWKITCINR